LSLNRSDLINEEWKREFERKESLERRGITVITTSGVLVTLIFAFAGAVAKGHHFGGFTFPEKLMIGVSLALFIISGIYGIATNTPRTYAALKLEVLKAGRGAVPSDAVSEDILQNLIAALGVSRERNDLKAGALSQAIVFQGLAILVVGVAIMLVII
jgi:hypothetical protein